MNLSLFIASWESWDFLAALMALISLWLLLDGADRLRRANPERVDARRLRLRACGGLLAGIAYLACHYLAVI